MGHVARHIARTAFTVLAAASLLFPGRVQKPMHEGIRQGVAVAAERDTKKATFEKIVETIKGFKTAQEAMDLANNPEKMRADRN